jgi:pimeloyl-ACP methyl ester carboxylesterase
MRAEAFRRRWREGIAPRSVDGRVATVVDNWFPRFLANGLDYLDVRRTVDGISAWQEWPDRWVAAGERYETLGDEALEAGHEVTAAAHLKRAALTYQFAQFVLTDDVDRRERIHRRMARVYRAAAPLLSPPAEEVLIPWRGIEMHGYLRRPGGIDDAPLVVLIPGLESTKEQFTTFEPYLLERGLATLSFEGPGQGETWYGCAFDNDDYLDAVSALRETIDSLTRVAHDRLALLGTSFGGYLAIRCAPALSPAAVVDIAGPYDLADIEELQPVIHENFAHFMKIAPDDLAERGRSITLQGVLPLAADLLVVHGEKDNIIPFENARRVLADQPGATAFLFPDGNHSCNNLHTVVRPAIGDWLADRLNAA